MKKVFSYVAGLLAMWPFSFLFVQLVSKGFTGEYAYSVGDGNSLVWAGAIWTVIWLGVSFSLGEKPKGNDHDDQAF